MVGDRIGNYRVVRKLGQGGMGMVFEAIHEQIQRRAAIKVLLADFTKKPHIASRFFNEARAVNIVGHPGLVNIFELGQLPDGSPYIVMEFLDGETLSARLTQPGTQMAEVIRLLRQVASALLAAHKKGIVHRDLKPDNVMVVPDPEAPSGERVKLLDFGLAKFVAEVQDNQLNVADTALKTHSGVLLGTPSYMAPEQCREAGEVTDKADVYSLGVMLYQFLAGRLPFLGKGAMEIIAMTLYETPRPLRSLAPFVPEELAALVHWMLAKKPEERPSMEKVVATLEQLGAPKASGRMAPIELSLSDISTDSLERVSTPSEQDKAVAPPPQRRRRRVVPIALSALGTLLLFALVVVAWCASTTGPVHRNQVPTDMGPRTEMQPSDTDVPRTGATLPAAETVQPDLLQQAQAPSPALVHLRIEARNCSAEVVQVEHGRDVRVLGHTPFTREQPPAPGRMTLELRCEGFFPEQLKVDLGADYRKAVHMVPLNPQ